MSEARERSQQKTQTLDRRAYYRLQMLSVCYVDLGDGNGGVLLNLSEGGFTLQAAEVLVADEFPRMRFQLPKSVGFIEAHGKLVWLGKSRKEAGIQFIELSQAGRQQIRDWMFAQTFGADNRPDSGQRRPLPADEQPQAAASPFPGIMPGRVAGTEWENFFPHELELHESTISAPRSSAFLAAQPGSVEPPKKEDFFPQESGAVTSQAEGTDLPHSEAVVSLPLEAPKTPEIPEHREQKRDYEHDKQTRAVKESSMESSNSPELDGIDRIRRSLRLDGPVSKIPDKIPFREALPERSGSKSEYLATYRVEPEPARTSWLLTAIVAFATGLCLAFLIAFGLPGFIKAAAYKIENTVNGVLQPKPKTPASAEILPESAPGPPDIFSQPRAEKSPEKSPQPANSNQTSVKEKKPDSGSDSLNGRTPSVDAQVASTDAYPVSPSVNQSPGVPVGYVASNSHFLSIRMPAGNHEDPTEIDGSVRIGQLIYSPQAIYPEQALQTRLEGIVKLHVIVGTDGSIQTISSAAGPSGLVSAATSAVRDWRYEPTMMGTSPVESEQEITFVFRL